MRPQRSIFRSKHYGTQRGGALLKHEGISSQNGNFGDIVFLALEAGEASDTVGGTMEAELDSLIAEADSRRNNSEHFGLD